MNQLDFVCFDMETSGLSIEDGAECIQLAGKAYNARSLEPYPPESGGEFNSLMRPLNMDYLDTPGAKKALSINRITKKELETAPNQSLVWNQFVAWVNRYNKKGTKYGAPIACGKNIRAFDLVFAADLCKKHCDKKEKTVLFNTRQQLDLEDQIFQWFENDGELIDFKFDTIREYFGISSEKAHSAIVDTRQTGALIMRILKLHRTLRSKISGNGKLFIQFKGSMKDN